MRALQRPSSLRCLAACAPLLAVAAGAAGAAARADVLQIGADGAVAVYDKPAVFTAEGVQPIVTRSPAQPRLSRAAVPTAQVRQALREAAAGQQLSPDLVEAVAWRESGWNTGAVSRAGAQGVMQLMPATARGLGVDPTDPAQNIRGGAAYLKSMLSRFGGDLSLGLAAYNAGPGAVLRYGGVPPYAETRAYVAAVLERLARTASAAPVVAVGAR